MQTVSKHLLYTVKICAIPGKQSSQQFTSANKCKTDNSRLEENKQVMHNCEISMKEQRIILLGGNSRNSAGDQLSSVPDVIRKQHLSK